MLWLCCAKTSCVEKCFWKSCTRAELVPKRLNSATEFAFVSGGFGCFWVVGTRLPWNDCQQTFSIKSVIFSPVQILAARQIHEDGRLAPRRGAIEFAGGGSARRAAAAAKSETWVTMWTACVFSFSSFVLRQKFFFHFSNFLKASLHPPWIIAELHQRKRADPKEMSQADEARMTWLSVSLISCLSMSWLTRFKVSW